jgi:predicted ATPase/signal transduction histidine kinase
MTVSLSGYQIGQVIYTGTRTIVYRGQRDSNNQRVVIKFLRNTYPTFSELLQFRNQYTIAKNLNIPGIIRPDCLEPYGNSYALVMADFGGISLREYSQTNCLELEEILIIVLQLVQILHDLHQNRVIHKDIKPDNILIHPESKQVKLIDFSIASLLPKETQEIKNPNQLEGTLAYLAPEQTGRMNRGIDYRADFYAFGVTLFELLAGQLPFESNDPMELVHSHIAKQPPSLTQFNIPKAIAQIVAKLMAKNAESRYQSALGLQYDLEICLHQLKETGKIDRFEIGKRDLCDRFNIPEKLYGRETEVQTLLDAFDRVATGSSELMLVAGFSGIGKTAVVNEVHKPIVRQRGYFIKGKFDQFNRNIPFSAFVQAFRDLMGQLLSESDAQLQTWKNRILTALGDSGQVIIDVIPELERIIGKQPPVPELSGTAAQNRFNLLFPKFIQVFATAQHPLVMFLDDLQWADSASLNLMQLLIGESQTGYLLAIGAYRDNEVSPVHPLMLTLGAIAKTGATVNTITLQPLNRSSLNQLVSETLNCPLPLAQPLTELVHQKTQGNPFFATQFLKALHQDELIIFDRQVGHWQCDLVRVREAALTSDVVEFMATQLQKLPAQTQEILKLAACVGNQFDLKTLAIVSEQTEVDAAAALWKALQAGLILPQSEVYKFYVDRETKEEFQSSQTVSYKFLHDRVQQAAYSLIPDDQKQTTHYHIGQLLIDKLSEVEQSEAIFDIVNHINLSQSLLKQKDEREKVARLNLTAAQKAISSTAYEVAIKYLDTSIGLLEEDDWISQYDLMFNLYRNLCAAQLSNASYEQLSATITIALNYISSAVDRADIYVLQVTQYSMQGEYEKAIQTGLIGLRKLGIEIESESLTELVREEFAAIDKQLEGHAISSLLELPLATDPIVQAMIKLLIILEAPIYIMANIELYSFISLRAVRLSIEHGNIAESIKAYANYGLLLGLMKGQYQRGYEITDLAVQLSYKLKSKSQQCKAELLLGAWVQVWAKPIAGAAAINYEGFLAGMESGETQFAAYNLYGNIFNQIFQGENLIAVAEDIEKYALVAERLQGQLLRVALAGAKIFTKLSLGQAQEEDQSIAEAEAIVRQGEISQAWFAVCLYYILRMHLACLTENFEQGYHYFIEAGKVLNAVGGFTTYSSYYYYGSLILLNLYPGQSQAEQSTALEQIRSHQERLKTWSNNCPENFLHKYLLVEAERCRLLGSKSDAIDLYDRAIAGAKENEYIQEEALANELAAKFYLEWGKEKVAAGYMQEAYYCYARWGALAKTDDLETRYPQLLQPILLQANEPLSILETLARVTGSTHSIHSSTSKTSTSKSFNQILDFAALLKVSQTLSGTIELDELLQILTQTMLKNSGANKCALMLPQEGEWQVRVMADLEQITLQTVPLNNANLPVKLIQYVKNMLTAIAIDNLEIDLPVIDDYLHQYLPKSVLCLPILDRGNLAGILYLENRGTSGVFTGDRILILNFLCTQAAISLENARLYRQAQQMLEDLQLAQLQLVQSEKMSALGNLVAGVAHEINNPIGCIVGNVGAAQDYINDLLGIIDLYQEELPQPSAIIEDELEAIDLDYVREDLPKLIKAMKDGGDRITSISKSLRTFSRDDSDNQQKFNLHDGIDSTLLILRHRLKANEHRPAIEIVTEYGNLPEIACFPGQLNQVFMNILANAIDALDEFNLGRSFAEIQANPNRITIRTTVEKEGVKIAIADNGKGIPEDVKSRIFDHLFTTKGVGKGTGLGLAIARQIIEEKHGGAIEVNSTPGQGTEFAIALKIQ